jgi:nucleoside 2-deoxyribosyltransferase
MPLLYSPIDGSELDGAVRLYPKTAFLMIHDNDRVSEIEAVMQRIVREEIKAAGFRVLSAIDVSRSGDFLLKIIRLIQGCGFGIAVFSDVTPPKTLANIFFEIGYCLALGKPTQLVLAGEAAAPSDFVRSEWIQHSGDEAAFRKSLQAFAQNMVEYGEFLHSLALTAEEAEELDPELAFERFKRAYLISGNAGALDGVRRIHKKLRGLTEAVEIGAVMRANRRNLSDEIGRFLRLAD